MTSCWYVDPSRRPLIRDIALQLGLILQLFLVSTKKTDNKGKMEKSLQTSVKSLQNA
uniref:Serine-threonine/tyrosine-protein kinase catalytic domain-containing protein n=1 Tax=Romanomermis culicivorax TaxID=13658 RepID=A0A915KTB1_ROMCU